MNNEHNLLFVNTLIFDLWETLAVKQFSVSESLRKHFDIPKSDNYLSQYEKAIQKRGWDSERDLAINYLKFFKLPLLEESINFIIELLHHVLISAKTIPGSKQLLEDLKKKYNLVLLSNTTCFESRLTETLGLKTYFDAEIYSWQTGFLKPAPEAFWAACKYIREIPSNCAYIDADNKNIEVAESIGIHAVHQTSFLNIRNVFLD